MIFGARQPNLSVQEVKLTSNPPKSIICGDASKFQYPGITLSPLRERSVDNIISNLRPSESPRYDLTEIGSPANGLRLETSNLTSSSDTFRGAISASSTRFLAFNSCVSPSALAARSYAAPALSFNSPEIWSPIDIVFASPSSSPAIPTTKIQIAATAIEWVNFGSRFTQFIKERASAATPANTINVEYK